MAADIINEIAFYDAKHDFAKSAAGGIGKDPNVVGPNRVTGQYDFFTLFSSNILRTFYRLPEIMSRKYGCNVQGQAPTNPEHGSLHLAINKNNPTVTRVLFDDAGAWINELSRLLRGYQKDVGGGQRKIPLIADTWNKMKPASDNNQLFRDNFIICRNSESYSDPGPTCKTGFHTNILYEERFEARNERRYNDANGGLINVSRVRNANDDTITVNYIDYTGTNFILNFNTGKWIRANSIAICKAGIQYAMKAIEHPLKNSDNLNVERCQNYDTITPGSNGRQLSDAERNSIVKWYIAKRAGDQLQVHSCNANITYTNAAGNEFIKAAGNPPLVFWSIDAVAIAFAILNCIPCVHEVGGNFYVYIPNSGIAGLGGCQPIRGGKRERIPGQVGGACTRQSLNNLIQNLNENLNDINNNDNIIRNNCIDLFLEKCVTYNSDLFNPYFLLYVLTNNNSINNTFIDTNYHMDSNGILITENGGVVPLTQPHIDHNHTLIHLNNLQVYDVGGDSSQIRIIGGGISRDNTIDINGIIRQGIKDNFTTINLEGMPENARRYFLEYSGIIRNVEMGIERTLRDRKINKAITMGVLVGVGLAAALTIAQVAGVPLQLGVLQVVTIAGLGGLAEVARGVVLHGGSARKKEDDSVDNSSSNSKIKKEVKKIINELSSKWLNPIIKDYPKVFSTVDGTMGYIETLQNLIKLNKKLRGQDERISSLIQMVGIITVNNLYHKLHSSSYAMFVFADFKEAFFSEKENIAGHNQYEMVFFLQELLKSIQKNSSNIDNMYKLYELVAFLPRFQPIVCSQLNDFLNCFDYFEYPKYFDNYSTQENPVVAEVLSSTATRIKIFEDTLKADPEGESYIENLHKEVPYGILTKMYQEPANVKMFMEILVAQVTGNITTNNINIDNLFGALIGQQTQGRQKRQKRHKTKKTGQQKQKGFTQNKGVGMSQSAFAMEAVHGGRRRTRRRNTRKNRV